MVTPTSPNPKVARNMSQIAFEHSETQGLISIVIPTFRGERFIGEALASISAQTDVNWEVIVVEDGSRGPTESIVREFAEKHPWHRVYYSRNEQNRGPSHTRNTAFKHVRGQYIALLDSDDRWYPDYLAVMRKALETTGKDIVYCSVVMIEDVTDLLIGVWGPAGSEIAEFPHDLLNRNFVTPSATVLRRSVLADVGNWNTKHRYCEDLEFWLRCVMEHKTFHYVGGVHCLYRRNHAEAATGKMCAVQEAHAEIAERFLDLPGTRPWRCRKYVSRAYLRAAEFHEKSNPQYDPSADRNRAPRLLLRAWYFRRNHVDYIWRAFKLTIGNSLRRARALFKRVPRSKNTTAAEPIAVPTQAAA
jgi:glycosyltransferase involved in cell wall biosynthesis